MYHHSLICLFQKMFALQDAADNITRFWVLSRDPLVPKIDKSFKVVIVFTHFLLFKTLLQKIIFSLLDEHRIHFRRRPWRII